MAQSREKSKRKMTGGRLRSSRTKRKFELMGFPTLTRLEDKKRVKTHRSLGGNVKRVVLAIKEVNVSNKAGKTQKTEIVNVIENPANPHLVRRNIITKGAVVETKMGKVRITSRPGQEGSVNGVLLN